MTPPTARPTCPLPREAGVTLLEVVLAVTLSAGIIGATMAFYHRALYVRDRLEFRLQAVESNRRVMDRITGELRAAMSYPFLGIGMEGTSDEISFITVGLPGAAAWAVRQDDQDPIPPTHDLSMVGYRLRIDEEQEGSESAVMGLERSVKKVLTTEVAEEDRDIERALLSPHVRYIGFRYWQDGEWLEDWSDQALPKAVEITLGAEPLEGNDKTEDYQWEVFRRVVYIPAWGYGGQRRDGSAPDSDQETPGGPPRREGRT